MKSLYIAIFLFAIIICFSCSKDEPTPTDPNQNNQSDIPSKPKNLSFKYLDSLVSLRWETPDNTGNPLISRYLIYRKYNNSNYENIGSVQYNITSYIDTSAVLLNTYTYVVSAINTSGESVKSNEVTAMPHPLGVSGVVYAVAVKGTDVYVGGSMLHAGGVPVNRIAKWDGTKWSALGDGIGNNPDSYVYSIVVEGNNIYVGGEFKTAGGVSANGIARWDGANWSSLGSGVSNETPGSRAYVSAIAIKGNDVYVGGRFTKAGNLSANRVAKWDGVNWSSLGSGVGTDSLNTVLSMAFRGNELYVGGVFLSAGAVNTNFIAMWNGNNWNDLSGGLLGTVRSIAVDGNNIFAGGSFLTAGTIPANKIARWDGSTWYSLANGINSQTGYVNSIVVSGSIIYVGGRFVTAGDVNANHVAKFSGTMWASMGSGLSGGTGIEAPLARSLAINGNLVYVGGNFSSAGGSLARNIAVWDGLEWRGF